MTMTGKSQIRPKAHKLVGFSAEEEKMIREAMRKAKEFMVKMVAGIDGMTEKDHYLLDDAYRIRSAWKTIMAMSHQADSEKCRRLLIHEANRAYTQMLIDSKINKQ